MPADGLTQHFRREAVRLAKEQASAPFPKNAEGITVDATTGRAYCYTLQRFRGFRKTHTQAHRPSTTKAWLYIYEGGQQLGRAVLTGGPEACKISGAAFINGEWKP